MPRTYRYSYWALAAGLVTLIGVGDAAACALLAIQSGKTGPAVADFLYGLLSIAILGPVCLIVGRRALRDVKRDPSLLGEGIAEIAVDLGWFVTLAILVSVAGSGVGLAIVVVTRAFSA